MCGRYTLTQPDQLQQRFEAANALPDVPARYNVAPSQELPVVTRHSPNGLELMQWGFVAPWTKDPSAAMRLINARAETVAERASFRQAFHHQRCLVPATGFYEWRQTPTGKVPYLIQMKDQELFAFAGLYSIGTDPVSGQPRKTYLIITTTPNELMASIHNRMPVILPREEEDAWLDPDHTASTTLQRLLAPYPAALMEAYPIAPAINNPRSDYADLVKPEVNSA